MALHIFDVQSGSLRRNTHLSQHLLHLVIWELLVTQIRFANAACNYRGSFRHRQVAVCRKHQVQEAPRGVVANVPRRDHGQFHHWHEWRT
jgi:hypothetical protein